jgi:RNA polymerase sigma-70 factor (ECF subfamily)
LTVNVVLMRLRRKNVIETSLDELAEQDESSGSPPREVGTPDLKLTGSVDRVNLDRAVAQLPPGYRAVFLLHDVEGYEHNEIADMMGCSIGNSKSQLHKARTRLRELLQEAERDRAREVRQEARSEIGPPDTETRSASQG